MTEQLTKEQRQQVLFFELISMFQSAAWQQLGKIKNPITDKLEPDLEQARLSIDMLAMIRDRMDASLNPEEKSLLDQILTNLRLNYVDELEKLKKQTPPKAEAKPEQTENPTPN